MTKQSADNRDVDNDPITDANPDIDPDCPFCSIVTGTISAIQVYADERTVGFMDINPASYGHLLVVPRRHVPDLLAIGVDDLTACTLAGQLLARHAVEMLEADGVNLINSCGTAAWQTVRHFHLHVIPRYSDGPHADNLKLPWVAEPGDADQITAAADALRD